MRTWLCWLAIASASCGGDKTASTPGPASGAPGATDAAAALEIYVDSAVVAKVSATQLAGWPRLDTLVPAGVRKLGTWEAISLQGGAGKAVDLARPSGAYPDMVPAVFPGEGGAPAFGMFDPVELARHGKPATRHDRLTAIRIKIAQGGGRGQNDDGGGAAGDPTKLTLTIQVGDKTTALTGAQLLALPREAMPGNADQKGWRLTALLQAAGVAQFARLVLTDAGGTTLLLDRKDVDDKSVPFVKLNKQGALRLRVLKQTGDGWNPAGDLRALVRVDVK